MVAERGRGEGGRGGGGRRRRRRRRAPALVAPTEGGGHRDPGAAAEDGREKDERAEESLPSPRRPRGVLEGDGRSERKRLGLRLRLGPERARSGAARPAPTTQNGSA